MGTDIKPFCILIFIFLFIGICSVTAQDMIILKDGNIIEAKVAEISPSEIRYKRYNNLEGPMIVIPVTNVLSIKYENGIVEIFNPEVGQESAISEKPKATAMDPNRWYVGINLNPGSLLTTGASASLELQKGSFFMDLSFVFPTLSLGRKDDESGFGAFMTFNYFHHTGF